MKKKKDSLSAVIALLDVTRLILLAVIAAMLLITFVIRKMEVVGPSMYPTLQEGESVFINIAANFLGELERFDVVAVRNTQTQELWTKRVIGLPNETIKYEKGKLYVDNQIVEEPFLDKNYIEKVMKENDLAFFTQDYAERKLGEDEYLLVGDNRNNSLDSRNEAVGPFKREQIIAKGMWVAFPISKARYISNGN